jgi:hypothetical protein
MKINEKFVKPTIFAIVWILFGKKFELSFTYGTARDGDDRHDLTRDLPRKRGGFSLLYSKVRGGHPGALAGCIT